MNSTLIECQLVKISVRARVHAELRRAVRTDVSIDTGRDRAAMRQVAFID